MLGLIKRVTKQAKAENIQRNRLKRRYYRAQAVIVKRAQIRMRPITVAHVFRVVVVYFVLFQVLN